MSPTADKSRMVSPNFITEIIDEDLRAGRYSQIVTRFPPEPNGYAHLGHAIASYLNYGIAHDYGGVFRLRMDDTNPQTERQEYADALIQDLRWLGGGGSTLRPLEGWEWGEVEYASDYFDELYAMAIKLVEKGLAYVDSVSPEEMARLRGTVDRPGTPSPYRGRSIAENLELFQRMKAGDFPTGAHVLRAKIDLASPNMKLRDPVLYRILHATHYRTGNRWCIYPSYDFAQAPTDALIGVTHSLCSLEFVDNRAVYDWLMDNLWEGGTPRPHQYEFGRRSLEYTVVSKRKLLKLIGGGYVSGWDDPRMPTLAGQRRRGVTPQALRIFAGSVGISRTNRTVDIALLEHAIRDDLNTTAPRVMAVVRPLKVILTNLKTEQTLHLPYWPEDVVRESPDGLVGLPDGKRVRPEEATRPVPLTREIYIEAEDFEVTPPKGFKRFTPGGTVRLRGAGILHCDSFSTNEAGEVCELHCTLLGHEGKAAGVIHWVSATQGLRAEFRLYDRLFRVPLPEAEAKELEDDEGESAEDKDFLSFFNPNSLEVAHGFIEPSVADDSPDTRYQFERLGYFWPDPVDCKPGALVFNRIVTLRDSWAKETRSEGKSRAEIRALKEQSKSRLEVVLSPEQQARLEAFKLQGIGESDALVLARDEKLSVYLTEAAKHGNLASLASWIVNDLGSSIREGTVKVSPAGLAELIKLLESGEISTRIAKDVLTEAQAAGQNPADIVSQKGLRQMSDTSAIAPIVERIVAANPDKVVAYHNGKTGLLGFFVGQVMRETGGQANPQLVQELIVRKLSS